VRKRDEKGRSRVSKRYTVSTSLTSWAKEDSEFIAGTWVRIYRSLGGSAA
jgi:hypothetical protein